MNKAYWKAIGIRAVKTFCQTLATMITVGQAFFDVNWVNALSVSVTAAIYSVATSIGGGLPEVKGDEDGI